MFSFFSLLLKKSPRPLAGGVEYPSEQHSSNEDLTCCPSDSSMDSFTSIPLADLCFLPLIKVEAGSFTMSADDNENHQDEVSHNAVLTKDFFIGKYPVTKAQWNAVMENSPLENKRPDSPVENVSWHDAMAFCTKLNQSGKAPAGFQFSLPTETQWEYAARGGNKSKGFKYSGGNNINEVAWYDENSRNRLHDVGRKAPNELGICDMTGNVWEWCLDDYAYVSSQTQAEFTRQDDDNSQFYRVMRGGGWGSDAWYCRIACRSHDTPSCQYDYLGFRVALVPEKY